jgi:Asp-tRNA(Asn)/Glu-tRNA(Gln) amidotransferase A subunit family amidase
VDSGREGEIGTLFNLPAFLVVASSAEASITWSAWHVSSWLRSCRCDGIARRDYLEAQAQVTTFLEQSASGLWEDCDVLATPTLAVPPFSTKLPLGPDRLAGEPIDPQLGWAFTWPFNLTGQPAVSIPCGWTKDGLPLGLQLVGRRGADGLVLRVAAALEALAPGPAGGRHSDGVATFYSVLHRRSDTMGTSPT